MGSDIANSSPLLALLTSPDGAIPGSRPQPCVSLYIPSPSSKSQTILCILVSRSFSVMAVKNGVSEPSFLGCPVTLRLFFLSFVCKSRPLVKAQVVSYPPPSSAGGAPQVPAHLQVTFFPSRSQAELLLQEHTSLSPPSCCLSSFLKT